MDFLLAYESDIRIYFFIAAFFFIALWETYAPRVHLLTPVAVRWFNNIGLVVVSNLLLALMFPVLSVGAAVMVAEQQWGLFNQIDAPLWLAGVVTLLTVDLSRYVEHVLLHKVPLLWRLHKVHHSDLDYDCTTGLRFHPLEAIITNALHVGVIALLGAPPVAVLIYELLFLAITFFTHGNIRMAASMDRLLRYAVVTPYAHCIHHSVIREETDSNFGILLLWWDRLFGTYRDQPQQGYGGMTVGLSELRDETGVTFSRLLLMPFARKS